MKRLSIAVKAAIIASSLFVSIPIIGYFGPKAIQAYGSLTGSDIQHLLSFEDKLAYAAKENPDSSLNATEEARASFRKIYAELLILRWEVERISNHHLKHPSLQFPMKDFVEVKLQEKRTSLQNEMDRIKQIKTPTLDDLESYEIAKDKLLATYDINDDLTLKEEEI